MQILNIIVHLSDFDTITCMAIKRIEIRNEREVEKYERVRSGKLPRNHRGFVNRMKTLI